MFAALFISSAWAQNFTEDISKINHAIAEGELDSISENPGTEIPGEILSSLAPPQIVDEFGCEEDPEKFKPLNIRYELIAVTQEAPAKPEMLPQTTVIVAKFKEEEHEIVKTLKGFVAEQVQGGMTGRFQLKQKKDASKHFVVYTAPGTSVNIDSKFNAQGVMNLELDKLSPGAATENTTIQMDVVNRLSVNQDLGGQTTLKTTIESLHTTGQRHIEALEGTKFELNTFKAQARLDSQLNRNVHSYSEVNFTSNTMDKELRAVAGFEIEAPNNVEIMVFTGFSKKETRFDNPDIAGTRYNRELGLEYKRKSGTRIFTRFKDGTDRKDRVIETGISIPLGGK